MDRRRAAHAFSLVELLVVLAALFVIAALLLPLLARSHRPAARVKCASYLKNVGLAFRIFAVDNRDLFPAQALSNEISFAQITAADYFTLLSNELSTPRILYCEKDTARSPARTFTNMLNFNISYFTSLSASEANPNLWLAGDRNLLVNNSQPQWGRRTISTNDKVAWTSEIHKDQGNIALADGSVQLFSNSPLQQSLRDAADTNLLLFP